MSFGRHVRSIESMPLIQEVQDLINKTKQPEYNPEFLRSEEITNPTLMIDWMTVKVPFFAKGLINGGNIINTTPDGEIEYTIQKRLPVRGSFDNRLVIRTEECFRGDTWLVSISGNPVKWLQGHNIFGSDDLPNLLYETVLRLSQILGMEQPRDWLDSILRGGFTISRVDINGMFTLPTRSDVYAWLNAAEKTGRSRHGTAQSKGNTVYFGKSSERWTVKCYSKGQELEKHCLPKELQSTSLPDFADNKLRVELTLRSKELEKHALNVGTTWFKMDLWEIYKEYVGRIEMSNQTVRDKLLFDLPKSVRQSYLAWSAGHDVRLFVGKTKFYKDRKTLLEYNIDILVPKPTEDTFTNVVPLKRVLELKPCGIPDWAYGTQMLFEPRKLCGTK